jgi:hypothetical protein
VNFRRSRVLAPVEILPSPDPRKRDLCRCRQRCAGRKLGSAAKKISRRIAIGFGRRARLCLKGAAKVGDGELARAVRSLMRSGYFKPPPLPTDGPRTSGRSKLASGAPVLAFARSSSTPRMETTDG